MERRGFKTLKVVLRVPFTCLPSPFIALTSDLVPRVRKKVSVKLSQNNFVTQRVFFAVTTGRSQEADRGSWVHIVDPTSSEDSLTPSCLEPFSPCSFSTLNLFRSFSVLRNLLDWRSM